MATAKKAAPAKKAAAPAKKAAPPPAKTAAPANKKAAPAPAKKAAAAPAKAAPAKKAAPAPAKAAPAKKAAPAPAKTAAPAAKAAPAKKAAPAPAKKAAPATPAKSAPAPAAAAAAAPAKKAAPVAKEAAAPAKKAAPPKPAAAPAGPPPVKGTTKDGIAYTKDFDAKFLTAMRARLLAEREELTGQARRLEDEANALVAEAEMGDVQFDDEGGEGDTMVVERERDLALSAQARQIVADIDAALARIEQGTYGYSVISFQPIPRERLDAIPWADVLVQEKVGGLGRR